MKYTLQESSPALRSKLQETLTEHIATGRAALSIVGTRLAASPAADVRRNTPGEIPLIIFANEFLLTTNHNQNESIDGGEAGWMRIDGLVASSTAAQQLDPAFLAVLVEKIDGANCAELPFAIGVQPNGDLLPRSVLGDTSL